MIRCALDTAVVKVEAVNIDICFHNPLNTETAVRRSRTRFAEATTGGYASIIVRNTGIVKQTFFYFTRIVWMVVPQSTVRLGQVPREIPENQVTLSQYIARAHKCP